MITHLDEVLLLISNVVLYHEKLAKIIIIDSDAGICSGALYSVRVLFTQGFAQCLNYQVVG
jgi:hypothetical protein